MKKDWLAQAESDEKAIEKAEAKKRRQIIERIEDELLDESARVVAGAMAFASIGDDPEEARQQLIERYGEKDGEERFRLAQYGQMSVKTAPIGITVARDVVRGVLGAKARREVVSETNLNLEIVTVKIEPRSYDVIDVTEQSRK